MIPRQKQAQSYFYSALLRSQRNRVHRKIELVTLLNFFRQHFFCIRVKTAAVTRSNSATHPAGGNSTYNE